MTNLHQANSSGLIHSSSILHATKKKTLSSKKNSVVLPTNYTNSQSHQLLVSPGQQSRGSPTATQPANSRQITQNGTDPKQRTQTQNLNQTQTFLNSRYMLKQLQSKTKMKMTKQSKSKQQVETINNSTILETKDELLEISCLIPESEL